MESFMRNCYYSLLDFTVYLNNAARVQEKRVVKLPFKVLSEPDVKAMLNEMSFKFWETFGYENQQVEEIKPGDGVFIQVIDPQEKADEHIFEDFMKSSIVTDIPPSYEDRDHWLKVIQGYPLFNVLQLNRLPTTDHIYIKPNPFDLRQQINAISNLQGKPRKEHRSLLRLFETKRSSSWPQFSSQSIQDWFLLTKPDFPGVDQQKRFVEVALGTPDFAILEGPPGSGKTITICELVLQSIKSGMRVLLCASTHVAVDNVLENLMDRDDVIAVRIGEESEKISPKVRKFLLPVRKKTERDLLITKLVELGANRNAGQEYYLNVLQSADGESEVEKAILENANLVCGTVMGMLKHPDIEKEKNTPRAVFDLLIIDEASKTTFQEFIVPAMYCKKWILVGDIKQLSPFVDDLSVRKTLDGLLLDDEMQICRDAFCCWKYPGFSLVVADSNLEVREKYKKQLEALGVEYLSIDDDSIDQRNILGHQVFIGIPEIILKHVEEFPQDIIIRGLDPGAKSRYSHAYWEKNIRDERFEKEFRGNWGELLSWRLIRLYQLRLAEGDKKRQELELDVEKLMPVWISDERKKDLQDKITSIKKVAFPSILELLQEGFSDYRNAEPWKQSVIKNGFDPVDFNARHVLLNYQHRMHPEISKFPREEIYCDTRANNQLALIDNPALATEREWGYKKYARRAIWVGVYDKNKTNLNININEALKVLDELKYFLLHHARIQRRKDKKPWEVAILTFYTFQEDYLRSIVTQAFGKKAFEQEFHLPDYNTDIKICTVDRFQGHEADVVFLSFVKTSSVGFLNSINRLNVALTRARYQLVMIGNKKYFLDQDTSPILQKLAAIEEDIAVIQGAKRR